MHAGPRTEPHAENDDRRNSLSVQLLATPREGLEQGQEPSETSPFSNEAKHNPKQLAHEDADMAELICARPAVPDVPDAIKAGIVAIVRVSSGR